MDTSALKPFAHSMRVALGEGVVQRLRYWGFKPDGTVTHEPEPVGGGYLFRDEVHSDSSVPGRWKRLRRAISDRGFESVAKEATYTWFNRLLAIRILEKNGYDRAVLGYAQGTDEPQILQRARKNVMPFLNEEEQEPVRQALLDSDDETAFRHLLTGYCDSHALLNDVFGRLHDYTGLLLPGGLLQDGGVVETLVTTEAISDEDFEQVELIGWLYQFYISEQKQEVYDKSGKFEPEDIPAATQIFTPNWIVRYMVENSLGKVWLEKYPDSPLREEMEYLVENENEDGATATEPLFDELPELQLFDPAAGSGHILVVGFDLLLEMYRELGYTDKEAVRLILSENLKGLDIDRRAAQLARFALLMKAAKHQPRVLDDRDVRPQVFAFPEPRSFSTGDLRSYLGNDLFDAHGSEIAEALALIREHGKNVGSALKFDLSGAARTALADRVAHWHNQPEGSLSLTEQELVPALHAYVKPLLLLTETYPVVAMNPPYMGSRQMNKPLKAYAKKHYPMSKRDLFAVFMEVGEHATLPAGRLAMINQQSWMFLSSYEDLRKHVLDTTNINSMLHLGPRTFDEISGEVVQSTAFVLQNTLPQDHTGTYFRLVDEPNSTAKKEAFEQHDHRHTDVDQRDFQKIPGAPVAYWVPQQLVEAFENYASLSEVAEPLNGMRTGDNKRFLRQWSEVSWSQSAIGYEGADGVLSDDRKWVPFNKGGGFQKWYGNQSFVVNWEANGREIKDATIKKYSEDALGWKISNESEYFQRGLTWSKISSGKFAIRYIPKGFIFSTAGSVVIPGDRDLWVLASFLNSSVCSYALRAQNPTMNFQIRDVASLPVRHNVSGHRGDIVSLAKECVRITKAQHDSRETSWDFSQHPLIQQNAPTLDAAYTAWQEEATDDFLQLHANEEELNDLFIDLYGLENELSSRVALDDITILGDELNEDAVEALGTERDSLSDDDLRARFLKGDPDEALFKVDVPIHQLLSYGIGVIMGRYRLRQDGLHIAHPDPSDEELAPYTVETPDGPEAFEIDDDAIVPLMGEDSPFSDDAVLQMRKIIRMIWGEDTLVDNLNFINKALSIGRSRGLKRNYEKTMEEWLVDDFWDWHKSLYSVNYYGKKPIYWLFRSPKGHFQVLVYMHRVDKFTAQRVRQQYLQRHQQYLRREIEDLEAKGEDTLTGDDAKRLDRLREAAADCRAYDQILKDVAEKQIEIDLDDGVQNNYPLFGDALADL